MHPPPSLDPAPSISLILPAWNEREVILTAIEEADSALRNLASRYEIIVVDDGSTDGTADLVDEVSQTNPSVRCVRHNPNQGYGAALRSGFTAAEMDLVVFTDADCQFDLTELDRFVLLSKRYDVVCGYRIDRKDTALRCLYSKVYNQLVRLLLRTGVRDVDCALKMFHRDVVKKLPISGNGFLVNSELLTQAKQQGFSVVEVGVSHRPRTEGESTVSIAHIPKVLSGLARYWWNAVQFPTRDQDCQTGPDDSGERRARHLQWALLLVAAIFMLTNLGYPLIDRDETRYAEIPREMLATGNWVLPQLNFQTYYDKPPLLYWLCAISFSLFGTSESSARLVPALAALATMASTMFFASRIFGRKIGLLSGVVLTLSIGFISISRYLLLDGVLALFVSLSLFTAYESIRSGKTKLGWWLLSSVFVGLAFLTKGPVAIVLWGPPVFAFAWLTNAMGKPRWWHYLLTGGVVAGIALPWCIAVTMQDPRFLVEFFYTHNVARFAGEFHSRPIWYFIPILLIAGHPWSFLTIPYAKFLFGDSQESRTQRSPAVGFMMITSVWCFVFFSLAKCKLPTYLMPAAPAMAIMIGHYLYQVLNDTTDWSQHWVARFWSARSATATTCFAGVGFVIYSVISQQEISLVVFAWGVLWSTLLVSSLLMLRDRHQAKLAWGATSGVAFLLAMMVMHQMVPAYSRSQTLLGGPSPFVKQLATDQKPAIATVAHEFSEVPFYLNRSDIPNFDHVDDSGLAQFVSQHQRCILVVRDSVDPERLREQLPPGTQLQSLGQHGRAQLIEATIVSQDRVAKRKSVVR